MKDIASWSFRLVFYRRCGVFEQGILSVSLGGLSSQSQSTVCVRPSMRGLLVLSMLILCRTRRVDALYCTSGLAAVGWSLDTWRLREHTEIFSKYSQWKRLVLDYHHAVMPAIVGVRAHVMGTVRTEFLDECECW